MLIMYSFSCSADAIYAKWKTNTTFVGHVNVRHAPNRFCYQVLVTNNQIELLIPHQDCQVSRIRYVLMRHSVHLPVSISRAPYLGVGMAVV